MLLLKSQLSPSLRSNDMVRRFPEVPSNKSMESRVICDYTKLLDGIADCDKKDSSRSENGTGHYSVGSGTSSSSNRSSLSIAAMNSLERGNVLKCKISGLKDRLWAKQQNITSMQQILRSIHHAIKEYSVLYDEPALLQRVAVSKKKEAQFRGDLRQAKDNIAAILNQFQDALSALPCGERSTSAFIEHW